MSEAVATFLFTELRTYLQAGSGCRAEDWLPCGLSDGTARLRRMHDLVISADPAPGDVWPSTDPRSGPCPGRRLT